MRQRRPAQQRALRREEVGLTPYKGAAQLRSEPTERHAAWSPGTPVTLRHVWFGRVWAALPMTVVQDTPTRRALYIAPSTVFVAPNCARAEHLRVLASRKWELVEMTWNEQPMLWTSVPGEAWSVWTIWQAPNWQHIGWKVNPEAPMKTTRLGFDTADYTLDAVVEPDLERWSWKDEDEFAEAIRLGLLTTTEATAIRGGTRVVVESLLTVRRDEMRSWAAWRPPAAWTIPSLALRWDVV